MTRYTKSHRTSPVRKSLTIAAASVLTVGALTGAGVAGANAATPAASTTVQAGAQNAGLLAGIRAAFSANPADGGTQGSAPGHVDAAKAKELATRLVNNQELFARFPAALQTDLKALASSTSTQDATTQAQKIRTTALSGGYGDQVRTVAGHLFGQDKGSTDQSGKSLLSDLRAAAGQGQQAADSAQRLAKKAVSNQQFFGRLPANLKTDLTALAGASGADVSTQAQKVKSTALDGGYGQQIQQLAKHLQSMVPGANPGAATPGGATGPASGPTGPANTGVGATTGL
ncbi:MAG: hypothetical protein M3017_14220 [Actinomycetota bacterium]|nr:hypothetical protein [Actinomycetota bacterium]